MDDVVRTLQDACRRLADPPLEFCTRERAFADLAMGRADDLGLLFSDNDTSRVVDAFVRAGRRPRVFRLWWNEGHQIETFLEERHRAMNPRAETQISFFPEVIDELPDLAGQLLYAPYVFTPPNWQPSPRPEQKVCFTGEVDISDTGLEAALGNHDDVERYSAAAWEAAHDVVEGRLTLAKIDRALLIEHGRRPTPLYRAFVMSTRSRVRYLLLRAVVAAFPGRVKLRGSDWRDLGFDALPTTRGPFRRLARLSDYRRQRVSLDLGSKCTNAALSPRAADIMAVGGGIVRFGAGVEPDSRMAILGQRTASNLNALLSLVDSMLSIDGSEWLLLNREIHDQYQRARIDVGLELAGAIFTALSGRAIGPL